MIKLSEAVAERGLKMYEQVLAFEALDRRRQPWIYVGMTLLIFMASCLFIELDLLGLAISGLWGGTMFFSFAMFHWNRMKARHATNLQFLTQLELRYGDQLPWVKVEHHLAAMTRLRAELKEEGKVDALAALPTLDNRAKNPAQKQPEDVANVEKEVPAKKQDEEKGPQNQG